MPTLPSWTIRAEGRRQEVDSALRLRRMPRDLRLRRRRPHRHRADVRRQQADRASRFRAVHRNRAARRQESEPITDPEDLARLPEGPAKGPVVRPQRILRAQACRAERLRQGQGQVGDRSPPHAQPASHQRCRFRTSPPSCWAARRLPCPPSYQYKPGDARRDIQEGWWVVKKYNCMGCHQFTPGPEHDPDGDEALSGRTGATASEASDRRRARRSRMAAEVPLESVAEHHRHKPQWRAALSASAHAHVLVLR